MSKQRTKGGLFRGLTYSRKIEIVGILIMAIAVLVLLSILSHHPNDYGIVRSLPSGSFLAPDSEAALRVSNWLGLAGVWISHFFVSMLFGYPSVILPLLVFIFGWYVFRGKRYSELVRPSAYGIWVMILFAAFAGWFYLELDWYSSVWSGSSGVALAQVLQNLTGIGSIVILSVLVLITVLVPIDRDLQKTVDAVRVAAQRLGTRLRQIRSRFTVTGGTGPDAPSSDRTGETDAGPAPGEEGASGPGEDDGSGIDRIVERSTVNDLYHRDREESETVDTRPRAVLDHGDPKRAEGSAGPEEGPEGGDDVEISVFVGEGDEEAEEKALDRLNKDKAKEIPVIRYKFPGLDLLDTPPDEGNEVDMEEIRENKRIILDKLRRHKIEILGINAIVGPTVTLYELEPAPDVKISKIQSYANDLKMATAAHGLRIIAPIPGRSAVGIEVPNSSRETVYIRSVIKTKKFVETDYDLPVAFGKTIENEVFMIDLTRMPHLLMAGATGSGKSVGINTIITCLLYKCHPDDLKFVMIDPKKIELSLYRHIQNHFLAVLPGADEPIVTDTSRALETLQSVCKEMDERYELLKMALVRDIKAYNEKFDGGDLDEELGHRHLPYIVVIIDELADLMMTAGKQIEEPIARLAQLARAIGIHLVVATQRPSVNVITGTIKANFPARIAYQVASKVDSRTILDVGGADQLVGRGDLLFTNGGGMTRLQNAFVSTEEVERITGFIGNQAGYRQPFTLPVVQDETAGVPDPLEEIDELFESAAKVVMLHRQGSVSLLQRKLKIGYNRAGRIIDQLYNANIVGPYQGSSAREVLIESEEELQEILDELDGG